MKPMTLIIKVCLILFVQTSFAQTYESDFLPSITPASIPSSPAFSLLGVNPELINRPSDIKQFKVDWRIKNYKLAPDLALEIQPIWWLVHRKQGIEDYRKTSSLSKLLSTASYSFGTAKIDNVNHLAYAFKLNLHKEKDPLLDNKAIMKKEQELKEQIKPILEEIKALTMSRKDILEKEKMLETDSIIVSLNEEIEYLKKEKLAELRSDSEMFAQQNWNLDMVDLAFGRVYKYDNAALDSLKFEKAGFGIWLNAAKGTGKNGLLTGMVKLNRIGSNSNWMYGVSYRHGSERFNFFIEAVRGNMNNNEANGFDEEEQFAGLRSDDLGSGWYKYDEGEGYKMWTVSYGGDFRLSDNILLNFSLRTELRDGLSFNRFIPIANLVCLMGE